MWTLVAKKPRTRSSHRSAKRRSGLTETVKRSRRGRPRLRSFSESHRQFLRCVTTSTALVLVHLEELAVTTFKMNLWRSFLRWRICLEDEWAPGGLAVELLRDAIFFKVGEAGEGVDQACSVSESQSTVLYALARRGTLGRPAGACGPVARSAKGIRHLWSASDVQKACAATVRAPGCE